MPLSYDNESRKANTKKEGWELRQKDSSWGYAVAHIIPLVWIYYSIKTNNYSFLYVIGSLIGFFAPKEVSDAFAILATPFLAKAGISQAKNTGH